MNNKERELVNENFVQRKDTYNLNVGGTGSWYACNSTGQNTKSNQYMIVAEKCKSNADYRKDFCKKVSNGMLEFHKNHPGFETGERNPMYGKNHTEETKKKLSENHKGALNSQFGKMWITNETLKENKCILKTEEIPLGWKKGRKFYK